MMRKGGKSIFGEMIKGRPNLLLKLKRNPKGQNLRKREKRRENQSRKKKK